MGNVFDCAQNPLNELPEDGTPGDAPDSVGPVVLQKVRRGCFRRFRSPAFPRPVRRHCAEFGAVQGLVGMAGVCCRRSWGWFSCPGWGSGAVPRPGLLWLPRLFVFFVRFD